MGHICAAVDLDTFMYAGPRGQKAERNIKVKKRAFKVYRTIRSFTFEKKLHNNYWTFAANVTEMNRFTLG